MLVCSTLAVRRHLFFASPRPLSPLSGKKAPSNYTLYRTVVCASGQVACCRQKHYYVLAEHTRGVERKGFMGKWAAFLFGAPTGHESSQIQDRVVCACVLCWVSHEPAGTHCMRALLVMLTLVDLLLLSGQSGWPSIYESGYHHVANMVRRKQRQRMIYVYHRPQNKSAQDRRARRVVYAYSLLA